MTSEQLTYEKSLEAAKPVKAMAELARTLDMEYLKEVLVGLKEQHSFRECASILNPNRFTVQQQLDLDLTKIKGLELMLKLAENQHEIFEKTVALVKAEQNAQKLGSIFGM